MTSETSNFLFEVPALKPHPARYTDRLLPVFARMLRDHKSKRVLDPMCGTGKVFLLDRFIPGLEIEGVEIEPEWAAHNPRTTLGSALALPWPAGYFDAVVVSPCLAHGHKILMSDLRWSEVENVKVGDSIIAFDEFGIATKSNGQPKRRKWRIGTVLRSESKMAECVRVTLSNGEEIVCTPEHPWLAQRFKSGGNQYAGSVQWVQTKDLIPPDTYARRGKDGSYHDVKRRQTGWWVFKQLDTWKDDRSYEAGWLAGIMDGEASLSFGTHGSPKLMISQVKGAITDLIQSRLTAAGIQWSAIPRKDTPHGRQEVVNTYIQGGFPGIMRVLGSLRPERLLSKMAALDIKSRSLITKRKFQVVSIEPVGMVPIQEIETSTGTYVGEGYLHHNCYGNRMSDTLISTKYEYTTYAHYLKRRLSADNGGALQWGHEYRVLHLKAWTEAKRVLRPGGIFILNCKNHIRAGVVQYVTEWHVATLEQMEFVALEWERVPCPGMRRGANSELRVQNEDVVLLRYDSPEYKGE